MAPLQTSYHSDTSSRFQKVDTLAQKFGVRIWPSMQAHDSTNSAYGNFFKAFSDPTLLPDGTGLFVGEDFLCPSGIAPHAAALVRMGGSNTHDFLFFDANVGAYGITTANLAAFFDLYFQIYATSFSWAISSVDTFVIEALPP